MVPTKQSKRNIVIVLGSGRWGGGEKNCVDLITGLKNYYNFILIHSSGEALNQVLENRVIQHYEFPLNEAPSPKKIFNFIKLINKFKPDLIHSHLNRANLYLGIAKPWIKCKWIATVHGFTSQIYNILPDHLICVSKAIQNDLPKRFRLKSTLIYNGIKQVNTNYQSIKSQQQPEESDNKIKAIVLATIHPNKGQMFVCKALKNYESEVSVEFIGTGTEKNTKTLLELVRQIPDVRLNNNIIHNIQSCLQRVDFVIIPSFREALSYVAIESLSLGTPVLASKTGGLSEVFTDGFHGHFFTPGNIASFRQGIKKMISDHKNLKQNLMTHPFLENNEQFTEHHMLEKVHLIYQKLGTRCPQ